MLGLTRVAIGVLQASAEILKRRRDLRLLAVLSCSDSVLNTSVPVLALTLLVLFFILLANWDIVGPPNSHV